MGFFSKKKSSSGRSVLSDQSMTRYEQRYCDKCGKNTEHKIGRYGPGETKAAINCTTCKSHSTGTW